MNSSEIIDRPAELVYFLPEFFPKRKKIKRIQIDNEGLISNIQEEQIFLENGKQLLK